MPMAEGLVDTRPCPYCFGIIKNCQHCRELLYLSLPGMFASQKGWRLRRSAYFATDAGGSHHRCP